MLAITERAHPHLNAACTGLLCAGTVTAATRLQDIRASNKQVLLMWADEWLRFSPPAQGYTVGREVMPMTPNFQAYGEGATVVLPQAQLTRSSVNTAVLDMLQSGKQAYESAVFRMLGAFPSTCLPNVASCARSVNTPAFITYMLIAPKTLEAVTRYRRPLGVDHSPLAGGVMVDYYSRANADPTVTATASAPNATAPWTRAVVKANLGWVLDYGEVAGGAPGGYNQCAYLFNQGQLAADIVCKGRPQALEGLDDGVRLGAVRGRAAGRGRRGAAACWAQQGDCMVLGHARQAVRLPGQQAA